MSDRKSRNGKLDIREAARREGRPLTKEELYKASATKFRSRGLHGINLAVVLCAVLAAAILAASVYCIVKLDRPQRTRRADIEQSLITETTALPEPDTEFKYIDKNADDVHRGYLILVNYENEYVPEAASELTKIYSVKTSSYSVAYSDYMLDSFVLDQFNNFMDALSEATGDSCVLVNSAYRSVDEQTALADDYTEQYGADYVEKYVAVPGYSEHHTGMALDLTIRYGDGTSVLMRDYENLETLNSMGIDYGFVARYPENKYSFTKINTEPWHYRYVGTPHSYIMDKNGFCLEEYITYIKDYTADGDVLFVSENGEITPCAVSEAESGTGQAVYFVSAVSSNGELSENTKIPVIGNAKSYEVSGNNSDGFIVTCTMRGE